MSRSPHDSRSVAAAVTAAGRLLRDRPASVLPAYLLSVGLTAAARVPLVVGLGIALASLSNAGRLEPLVRAVVELQEAASQGDGASGLAGPGVDDPLPPGVTDALEGLVTPTAVAAVGGGIVGALLFGVLIRGVVSAVVYGTVWTALDSSRGDDAEIHDALTGGVANAGRWRTYLGIVLVRILVAVVAVGVPLAVAGIALASVASGTAALGAVGILGSVVLVGVGALTFVLAFFLLAFAEAAATVDSVGAGGAVRRSLGFIRAHPAEAVAFALVAVGGYVAVAVGVTVANVAGFGSLGGLLLPLVVAPILDAGAVALYAGVQTVPASDRDSVTTVARRTLGYGVRAVGGFLRGHPLAVVAAHAVLAGGIVVGYRTTAAYGVTAPPPADVGNVFGAVAVGPFVTIAVNNWLVGVGLAFGGLAFGVPAVSGLVFNGVLIGALAGVFDQTAFLALVAPHGVLELPVIAVTGALGFHLGVVGWRAVRGRADAATVADELRRAAVVLVGIGVLLVVAAAIEAFLTPVIAAQVLGG
ncbi:stage II sporulation protein M [Halobaculum limi]|uniref:stage II sporulation protein M n=1 Tax=Halobaculum limi TaxID=3031916 RepID=UPI002405DDA2|nr:stage II sporulation protein M [Halobaculum sp. YSMS11]